MRILRAIRAKQNELKAQNEFLELKKEGLQASIEKAKMESEALSAKIQQSLQQIVRFNNF